MLHIVLKEFYTHLYSPFPYFLLLTITIIFAYVIPHIYGKQSFYYDNHKRPLLKSILCQWNLKQPPITISPLWHLKSVSCLRYSYKILQTPQSYFPLRIHNPHGTRLNTTDSPPLLCMLHLLG